MKELQRSVSILATFLGVFGSALADEPPAGTLILHTSPDLESPVVLTIELPNPDIVRLDPDPAAPMPAGWHRYLWEGGLTGFVPVAEIGKDLEPVAGAPLHQRASADSPVLWIISEDDSVEVLETGDWWRVFVDSPIPLYALTVARPEMDLVALEEILAPVEQPEVVDVQANTVSGAPLTVPQTLQRPAVPIGTISSGGHGSAAGVPVLYEGVVRRSQDRPFSRPPYPFQLVTAEGRRVAWLDTRDLVLSGTMAEWIGQTVLVVGEESVRGNTGEIVVRVRSLRRK
ncbi:MAG: hypothetical protein LR015_11275 [Verrucomicrobia bacterium]|nr:hypothetical protein [Verrucomicrobiota bacterium]